MKKTARKRLLTCDEYVRIHISEYPTLYAKNNYEESKIKVLDQLLNVIGNGVRDDDELKDQITVACDVQVPTKEYIQKYFDETIFYGFYEADEITLANGKILHFPKGESFTCVDSERKNHPEIVYWMESDKYEVNLYPNFQERYSTIYQCPKFLTLDESWIDGAIFYYTFARGWIMEHGDVKYNEAYPGEKPENTIKSFLENFAEYKTNEEISKAYEQEYDGDIYKFVKTRWEVEKTRIIGFIDKTLKILNERKNENS